MLNTKDPWSTRYILSLSSLTQLSFILLQWAVNGFIPDHKPLGVFQSVRIMERHTHADTLIHKILQPLVKWDGVYFTHIANFGYTYENTTAFFPFFPVLVSILSYIFKNVLFTSLNSKSCLLLSATLVNTILFSLAAVVLYRLALLTSNKNYEFSATVILLFNFNPARIFFIAPYSEAAFSLFTFLGILSLYQPTHFNMVLFFALATASRSNGLINIGFIVHKYLCNIYTAFFHKKRMYQSVPVIWNLVCMITTINIIFTPFIFYQNLVRIIFCREQTIPDKNPFGSLQQILFDNSWLIPSFMDKQYFNAFAKQFRVQNPLIISQAKRMGYVLPGYSNASYCYNNFELPYSYIQKHYWQVGFLKYFQIKQIPNFLLALPVFLIVAYSSYDYFIVQNKISLLKTLKIFTHNPYVIKARLFKNNNFLFSYYLHLLGLSVFCLLCMHVQVSTRMLLSSSPLIYFAVARYIISKHKYMFYFKMYFIVYCVSGIFLFTNYYPWT